MKYSFVIPCYQSENTIGTVVDEIKDVTNKEKIYEYEIILVNDHSPDNVWGSIQRLAKENKNVVGINLSKNFGQHAALMAGYAATRGDYIVSLDDDGQSPIDELNTLIQELESGKDVVYAYFDDIKQKQYRKMGTTIATKMSQKLLGAPKDFKGSSFYVAKRFVIEEIIKYNNSFPYLLGLVLRVTRNIGYVSTQQRTRLEGRSGYSFRKLISLWVNGFTAFSVKPLEIAIWFGFILGVTGFIGAIITFINKIVHPSIAVGWSSTMCLLLVIGGVILFVLGLIGEYVGRIYICINNAPQYVINQIVGKGLEETGQGENNESN